MRAEDKASPAKMHDPIGIITSIYHRIFKMDVSRDR
jgi:hypothetical protein